MVDWKKVGGALVDVSKKGYHATKKGLSQADQWFEKREQGYKASNSQAIYQEKLHQARRETAALNTKLAYQKELEKQKQLRRKTGQGDMEYFGKFL